jgi:hypothetical protein
MRGEILQMRLPSRAMASRLVKRQPPFLHDQAGPVALGNEFGRHDGLLVLTLGHGHHETPGRIAHVHPASAFRAAGEAGPELPAQPKVAFHPPDPARQPPRVSERRPQIIDAGVEDVFQADDGLAVNCPQRTGKWRESAGPLPQDAIAESAGLNPAGIATTAGRLLAAREAAR